MYILVLVLPFISFIQACLLGFYFGRQLSSYFSVTLLILSCIISWIIFYEVNILGSTAVIPISTWFTLGLWRVKFGLLFDSLTATMLVVITTISCLVHLYSTEYMSHDPYLTRFLGYLSLFTFFMLILVTADNFVQLFMGWEGVGLCSYLLINFWFTRYLANKAALKAMIMNRIADVFFILAIFLILLVFGSSDYLIVFNMISTPMPNYIWGFWNIDLIHLICFFLIFGAIGKSAQLGFHTWLPDAMEGPTPVSSLLHAATMVTAGVFLIIRCSPLFEYAPSLLTIISIFGGLTAFFAAFVAVFQWDLKKVIAYSTCSQLGYMFLACGLSFYSVALFHLFNHAFFKALLFLSAGSIIHALEDEQDMRRMGGLLTFLPLTFVCMLFGSMAIMGFPFLTGFYSKDLILELLLSSYLINSFFFYLLALSAAFLTALYSIRLLVFVFLLPANFFPSFYPHEPGKAMTTALFILVLASILVGFVFSDLFVGYGSPVLTDSVGNLPLNSSIIFTNLLSPIDRNWPLIISIAGSLLGFLSSYLWSLDNKFWKNTVVFSVIRHMHLKLGAFSFNAGFFNVIYNDLFVALFKLSYKHQTKLLDKGLLEYLGPIGLYRTFSYFSRIIRSLPYSVFLNIGFMFFGLLSLYIITILIDVDFLFASSIVAFWPIVILIICYEFKNK